MANKKFSDLSKGTYNNATSYTVGDFVNYNGSSYACIQNSTGNLPTDTTFWALLASKGDTGATGPTGPTGANLGDVTQATAQENVTGTDNSKYITPLANAPAFKDGIYRQAIINGNFDVWQRGTSFTVGSNTYTADRWETVSVNGAYTATINSTITKTNDGLKITTSGTDTGTIGIQQRIEKQKGLVGNVFTISFKVKKLDSAVTSCQVYYRADSPNARDGTLVGSVNLSSLSVGQSTTFSASFTIPAITSYLSLFIGNRASFSISTDAVDVYEFSQVQLNEGSVALPFQPKSYAEELRDCQRYYWRFKPESGGVIRGLVGTCTSTSNFRFQMPLITTMRTVPTLETTGTTTDYAVGDGATATALTAVPALVATGNSRESVSIDSATGATLTQFRPGFLNITTDTAYLGFNAEL